MWTSLIGVLARLGWLWQWVWFPGFAALLTIRHALACTEIVCV